MIFIDWLPTLRIACVEGSDGAEALPAVHAPVGTAPDVPARAPGAVASREADAGGAAALGEPAGG